MSNRTTGLRRAAIWVALVLIAMFPGLVQAQCRDTSLDLRGNWGQAQFSVEVVDSPETRNRGLMFRETMGRWAGMLFVYEEPGRAVFWMRNTLISLDLIFMDPAGIVTRVHTDAVPMDETPIDGGAGILYVLEVNAGVAARLGIAAGTEMRHARVDPGLAAWPCEGASSGLPSAVPGR
jgi:uncharacterized membrane protein (UPF0127 family)